ncbi:MAG: peptidylprolyl isomerase [Clostridia bacterium]|nr:peptidylprolyl isomerase [Clostridia bacterium]
MKRIIALLLLAVMAVSCFAACSEEEGNESFVFDENKSYKAEIIIKDYGTIKVALDAKQAPITVENFVTLAQSGFYDGLTFHRIIEGFMMQGGDPKGNGTGDSGKDIIGEFAANGYTYNTISHKRGVISMARANPYNSGSCQFFIMHQDYTGLDGQYAAFGWVTEGMDVVDKVCTDAQPIDNNGTIPAAKQPVIETIKITWDE